MSKIFNALSYCKKQEAGKTLIKITIDKNTLTFEH